jgi:hypothetical protein
MAGNVRARCAMSQRLGGLDGFLKLLCIPLLLAQFRGSPRGWWVIFGFLGAALGLLVVSWSLAVIPGLPWRGRHGAAASRTPADEPCRGRRFAVASSGRADLKLRISPRPGGPERAEPAWSRDGGGPAPAQKGRFCRRRAWYQGGT